jgi:hypothetical protein
VDEEVEAEEEEEEEEGAGRRDGGRQSMPKRWEQARMENEGSNYLQRPLHPRKR